jgi:ATP-dependent DNA ligase
MPNKMMQRKCTIHLLLPRFKPLPLDRSRSPFSHSDWLFEIKWDGFRSLSYVDDGECKLVSRNDNEFKSFPVLNASLPTELSVRSAVLDGEIVCLDEDGRPQFRDLLFRRGQPRFMAFDLLFVNGEDLRHSRLVERKQRIVRATMVAVGKPVLFRGYIQIGFVQRQSVAHGRAEGRRTIALLRSRRARW